MAADPPLRASWRRDLAAYLAPDHSRSVRQLAGVVVPNVGIWLLAAVILPSA